MPEHWLTFTYQYGIGGAFFIFVVTIALKAGVVNLKTRNGKTIFSLLVGGALLFMVVHILWIQTVMAGYVFSANQKYIKYLEKGSVKEIAKSFTKNGITLSEKAEVKTLKKDKTWLISDTKQKNEYIVKKAENFSNEKYLFSISKSSEKELDKGKIPQELRSKFQKYHIEIVSNFQLKKHLPKTKETNDSYYWFFDNDEVRYFITPITTLDVLNVYRLGKYTLNIYKK